MRSRTKPQQSGPPPGERVADRRSPRILQDVRRLLMSPAKRGWAAVMGINHEPNLAVGNDGAGVGRLGAGRSWYRYCTCRPWLHRTYRAVPLVPGGTAHSCQLGLWCLPHLLDLSPAGTGTLTERPLSVTVRPLTICGRDPTRRGCLKVRASPCGFRPRAPTARRHRLLDQTCVSTVQFPAICVKWSIWPAGAIRRHRAGVRP